MPELRVIDFGVQSPLRSQTLWHAVAYGVSAGAPPTLSFVRPSAPYVSIGYHRRLDEVDVDACRRSGIPVYRRMIGGGPVYLDDGQLFFQITLPASDVGAIGASAMRRLLEPAVRAFRDVGVGAELADDICVGRAKVSGIGGGRIADAAVAVGNLIERFDHAAASAVVADPLMRAEVLRLMRRFVTATPADPEAFKSALVRRCCEAFGLEARSGEPTPTERRRVRELDAMFTDPAWLRGPERPDPPARHVKVRAGVYVHRSSAGGASVTAAVVHGRIDRIVVVDPGANGDAGRISDGLRGLDLDEAQAAAGRFGAVGERVAQCLGRCDRRPG